MNIRSLMYSLLACSLLLANVGCLSAPGKPKAESEGGRPDDVHDFATLYGQNCAACHGDKGKNGAAISLANPVYLAIADVSNLRRVISSGVPGTMMPPFGKSVGGMLTDQQIGDLAQGMMKAWGSPAALSGQTAPAYAGHAPGDPVQGQKSFAVFCARCHGESGEGVSKDKLRTGSLVDPAYLALVSEQGLRSIVIAGEPDQGMPDWRSDLTGSGARAMTDQEVTDTVAWLVSHRVANPGQPYQQRHP
ncbi:cytochrome c [Granulicella sp. dw_53]|uniref:c-type cytochrome n=1 Tax=Granulicella sp. dw_53 TaxID=2719792 RepID=UPI001BD5E8F6|nr:cytochrome c [Granulicella sp. dw_53]